MRYLNRYAVILFFIFSLYYLFSFMQLVVVNRGPAGGTPPIDLLDSVADLKLKVEFLQNLVNNKQNDINNLKETFAANIKFYDQLVDRQRSMLNRLRNLTIDLSGNGSDEISSNSRKQAILLNHTRLINGTRFIEVSSLRQVIQNLNNNDELSNQIALLNNDDGNENDTRQLVHDSYYFTNNSSADIELPSALVYLPHLKGRASAVQPRFKQSKKRFAKISIGIPTIRREKTSYLLETLKSLFDAMNDLEKHDALVVVMIAELEDNEFLQSTIKNINKVFQYEMDSGLIDIIVPPLEYYPSFEHIGLDKVFNDSLDRVKWRTKQNYDFSFLMAYCQKRSYYYLQLEDDVVSKAGFFGTIQKFITKQPNDEWMLIEFSQLGFIGKLFKTKDLTMFINFFLMFAKDKPCDWLYESVFDVKTCNPERGEIHCGRSKADLKIKYKPSLFQHVGVQSSLKGKTQKLKDKDFGKQLVVAHSNPEAKLSTSLKTYMKYSLESVYVGQNYFWCMAPKANDYILFEFFKPTRLERYYVKSGSPEHPDDKLCNATFQIQFSKKVNDEFRLPAHYIKTQDDFYIVEKFSNELGTVNGQIDAEKFGTVAKIRIHIAAGSDKWIIISEIDFSSSKKQTVTTTGGAPREHVKSIKPKT